MLARIVENWLTSAGERGYQAAFAQLLAAEGYRILYAPVHHPFEHGKDLIAYSPEGNLLAFQLKGGDLSLADLETIQGQLLALAGTAISYPGVEPPRRPERVFLVVSGDLSAPARDRLHGFNEGRPAGFPVIETIERPHLVGRFVTAHGEYLPTEPQDLNDLLEFILADGGGPFPIRRFATFLEGLTASALKEHSHAALRRAIGSEVLLTAYSTGAWQRLENHLEIARAWLVTAAHALAVAAEHAIPDEYWRASFEIARDSARAELRMLLDEASSKKDLIRPDLVEGIVHPSRAVLVCGFIAAFFASERELDSEGTIREAVRSVLLRELPNARVMGEASAPALLLASTALQVLGKEADGAELIARYASELSRANQPDSRDALPDPYHPVEEVLLSSIGEETSLDGEDFYGQAYTLHVAIEWLARRGYREIVQQLWPEITRTFFCETKPSTPARLLAIHDDHAEQLSWAPKMPQSWRELVDSSRKLREDALPDLLWQESWLLPYLPAIYPHRLTSSVAKAIDYLALNNVEVETKTSE